MYDSWEFCSIYFMAVLVLIALPPPLIYSYAKTLLDEALLVQDENNEEKMRLRKILMAYYYVTDQVIYTWFIYNFFCIINGLLYQNKSHGLSGNMITIWFIYNLIIIGISVYTYFNKKRNKDWGEDEARIFIILICIYSLLPIDIVLVLLGILNDNIYSNFNLLSCWLIGIGLGYYMIWWVCSIIKSPMQAMIRLKSK